MISLEDHPAGVVLPVKAQPAAHRAGIAGVHDGMLKVSVTQAADKGKANAAIVEVLAELLGLRKSQLELLSGHTARAKRFLVRGMDRAELVRRVAAALQE
jgi:uncharacterized protein (TIGR00251 family)